MAHCAIENQYQREWQIDKPKLKENIQKLLTVSIANKIEIGKFGTVATNHKNYADGY